ncbi:Sensory box histidine kinase/response regulator [Limnobacter sp. 130]|uniref:ATP-binding protein n=1 Tax=Limnobacter sp. 130 TaxID=2653147 RepID=UPI0012F09D17|nr:ATP-binding protein [Limnobacter sp. 130]VWX35003.1 Sensory box histidine kinase/response regulator [Limnobacter sp. 130]
MNNVTEYLPHGFCIAWNPQLLAMHVISDLLIAIAYFSIPIGIVYVAKRRPDAVLQPVYYLFAAFILACGVTHVMGILTLWVPLYYTQGITKMVTALVSIATAIYLLPKLKHLMALPDLGKLTQINSSLAQEIESRRQSEATMRQSQELALQAQKTQAAFLANMSHEIRTPMNGVLGTIDLLLDTELKPEQHQLAAASKRSAASLLSLLNDILDISKVESGQMTLRNNPLELAEVFTDVEAALTFEAQSKNIELHCPAEAVPDATYLGDSVRLRQILLNLVGNAIKFTDVGHVKVTCREVSRTGQQAVLEFTVKDTGVGIAPEHQKNLFKRFTQVDNSSTRRAQGSGLGLAIVKELVELMGGQVHMQSKPNQGTEVVFTLKLAVQLPIDSAAVEPAAGPIFAAPAVAKFRGIILVVEDAAMNQMVVCKVLERLGLESKIANNGQEALDLLAKESFDLVLMDGQMPVMDGYEATKLIRSGTVPGINKNIPVVALTAHAMVGEDQKCLDAGMNDYLSKPLERDKLINVLGKYLKQV